MSGKTKPPEEDRYEVLAQELARQRETIQSLGFLVTRNDKEIDRLYHEMGVRRAASKGAA